MPDHTETFQWMSDGVSIEVRSDLNELRYIAEDLGLTYDHVYGDILVIGHGPAMPERVLLSTEESFFGDFRKPITSVTCIDYQPYANPQHVLNLPVIHRPAHISPIQAGDVVEYYQRRAQLQLALFPPKIFNTVLMFRLNFLEGQLAEEENLFGLLAPLLRSGGYIIGEGKFYRDSQIEQYVPYNLNVMRTSLVDGDPYQRVAFLLQKFD